MAPVAETSLGGSKFRFGETLWTAVLKAREGARDSLDRLIRIYWKPVYHFIRRRGARVEDAKDLTQGFFAMMLEKDFLKSVDPGRGKFKTFLLTVLERFLANERERAGAKKRGGSKVIVPLDVQAAELELRAETPEQAFERAWGATVLGSAFTKIQGSPYAEVLHLRLSMGLGAGEIARRLRKPAKEIENALARGRKKFREAVIDEILQYVGDEAEAEEEIKALLSRFH